MASVHFGNVSNRDLINNTRELVRSATTLEVKLLYHFDEIRSRGIESCMGRRSPMQFAIEVLGMTPDQAAKRSAAVTNCRAWPELMLLLENNQISLTTINLVGPKLTSANKDLILNEIIGKSTREVRQLLAEVDAFGKRRRRPALIDVKLALPADVLERWEDAKALVCGVEMATMEDALTRIVDDYLERYHPLAKAQRAAERAAKKALAAEKPEIKVEENCRAASDGAEIGSKGCGAATESPVAEPKTHKTKGGRLGRYVSNEVKHALWNRAQGRCENPGCTATHNLQIDHKQAFSRGGGHELDNLQLLCPSCHKQKTLREFGREWQRSELRRRVDAIDWMWYSRGAFIPPVVAAPPCEALGQRTEACG